MNNTIDTNISTEGGGGLLLYAYGEGTVNLYNNIITNNTGTGVFRYGTQVLVDNDYNDVWNNTPSNYEGLTAGSNSISSNPAFVSSDDYHLSNGPCVDAGTNCAWDYWWHVGVSDIEGNPRFIDGAEPFCITKREILTSSILVVDMGAYEYDPTGPELQCGDVNNDCVINLGDLLMLVNYVYGGGNAPCPLLVADCDMDGAVDFTDIIYLANYLFNGGPPPCGI